MEIFTMEITAKSRLRPEGEPCSAGDIFHMLEIMAAAHGSSLGYTRRRVMESGALWIVAGHKVQFLSMPRSGDRLRLSTWPGKTSFAFLPRHCRIEDLQGNLLIRAVTDWALLGLENRGIFSPEKAGIVMEPVITGDELKPEKYIPVATAEPSFRWTVLPEEIDGNGHVNNTVYADRIGAYLTDAPDGPHFPEIHSIAIQYRHELCLGDTALIRTQRDGDRMLITGECGGRTVFCAAAE